MNARSNAVKPDNALPRSNAHGADWALFGLAVVVLVPALAISIANVALPTIAEQLHAPFAQIQWVVLAYLLAVTTAVVSAGRLGDLVGRRRLMLAGTCTFVIASLACGLAPSIGLLIAGRFVQGLGAAVMIALSTALAADLLPSEKIGRAMGMLGAMSAVGTALGPALGGFVITALGWRGIFFVNAAFGALAFGLSYGLLPASSPMRVSGRFSVAGTILLAAALASYALGVTVGGQSFGIRNVGLLLGAALAGIIFLLVQARSASPIIRLGLLRNPTLGSGLATNALVSTLMMSTLVVSPFYLSMSVHLSPAMVGICLCVGPVASAATGVPAGRMADRFGSDRMILVGLILQLVGVALLTLTRIDFGAGGYVGSLVVLTIGYAVFQAANNARVMQIPPKNERGVVSGMLNLARNIGLITGASVMGTIFAHASAAASPTEGPAIGALVGVHATYGTGLCLCLVALAVALVGQARASVQSVHPTRQLEAR